MGKDFDGYLDELCREKKKEKERKKQLYKKNVKGHIVYMDEYGRIYRKEHCDKQVKKSKFESYFKVILCSIILALIIYIMYELAPLVLYLTS
jgi:S-adenosylmethionine hydrolase